MLLTGTFDKNKINIPKMYENDIEITGSGKILIKYNAATKIIDMANAIKILGAPYILNGFDEIQSISGGAASAGETKLAKIIIEGKSEQAVTTQGKNLFDKNRVIDNYRFAELNNDNIYDATCYMTPIIKAKPNTTYKYNRASGWSYVRLYNSEKTIIAVLSVTTTYFTTNSDTAYIQTYCPKAQSSIENFQIEEGTSATTYAPFVPSSPSPDYPSTINSVSNFDLVSSGKNLFDKEITPDVLTVNTFSEPTETGIRVYNTVANTNLTARYLRKVKPNTNYRIEFNPIVGSGGATVRIDKAQGGVISSNTTSFTFTTPSDTTEIRILFYCTLGTATTGNVTYSDIMLTEGSSNEPYEGFRGDGTINFPNITLRSLPDGTKDYIEIDNVNKTAKLYRNVGEYTFTGNENIVAWVNSATHKQYYTNFNITKILGIRCSHFKDVGGYENVWLATQSCIGVYQPQGKLYLSIENALAPDVATLLSWLATQNTAGAPVTVQYKLATTSITDLTYQELPTEYPISNIYTTSTVKPKIIGQVINK